MPVLGQSDPATLLKRIEVLADEAQRMREAHDDACRLVAEMHAAAVGEVRGPIRGVVEDVKDLRAESVRQAAELKAIRDAVAAVAPGHAADALRREIEFAIASSFLWDANADSGAAKRLRDSILAIIQGEPPTAWTDPDSGTVWPLTGRLVERANGGKLGGEWWTHSGWVRPLDGDQIPTFTCHHFGTGDVRDAYLYVQLPEVVRRYGPLAHDPEMPVDLGSNESRLGK